MDDPRPLYLVFAGAFGLVVGSFLNVVIFRLPRACMSIAAGRSKCPGCRRQIAWYDNIPVASWIALRGRCRACGEPVSGRYAFVELLTGALFLWAAYAILYLAPGLTDPVDRATLFAIHAYLIAAIVASTFIDIDFQILPDEINWSGLAFGLAAGAAFPELLFGPAPKAAPLLGWLGPAQAHGWGLAQSVLGALAGGGVIFAIRVAGTAMFWWRVKRLKLDSAMGLGDVKYMAFLGAFLGWSGIALALLVSMLAGAAWGVARAVMTLRFDPRLRERPERMGIGPVSFAMGTVPFGPFLSAGALAALFARPWIVRALEAYLDLFRAPA